jgi:hypothetical protein
VAFSLAWSELQTAANNYRLLPAGRRDEDAQRQLVNKVKRGHDRGHRALGSAPP